MQKRPRHDPACALCPYIAIAALALFAWFQHSRIQTLDVTLDSTTEKLVDAQQDITQAKLDLSTAVETAHKNALSLSKMQAVQNSFRADLSQYEVAIGNMQRDIEEIRNWADQPLPADIAGLRKRLAFTGSGAYAEFMFKRYLVPAARSEPQTNSDLSLDLERVEIAWAICAAQIDSIIACQNEAGLILSDTRL